MAPPPLDPLLTRLHSALVESPPGRSVWVALSGGLDSTLLLTLAAAACKETQTPLKAIHVHHGLQTAAETFEEHCHALCMSLNVPLTVARVSVQLTGQGVEGAAREARYAAFAEHVPAGDVLWLAQHQNDQAETFLLAALRGSGIRGLAAMPYARQWNGVKIVRPWRDAPKQSLERAARALALNWCEDPSNVETHFDRNFLRHRVVPMLGERWPHGQAAFAAAASQAGEADALLSEYALEELATLRLGIEQLDAVALKQRSAPRQRLLIRIFCQQLGVPTPPRKRLESLLSQLDAGVDAQVRVAWGAAEARVWQQRLYLLANRDPLPAWQIQWDGRAPLKTPLGEMSLSVESKAPLIATWRQGGEVLDLPTRGRRDLKRLLQEANIPPWERERVIVFWRESAGCTPRCIAAVYSPSRLCWQAAGEKVAWHDAHNVNESWG
ncbi:tRNA lysidine(34) synthetase TilS [Halomonas vilamensis]|uniref:tRNA(Ile)-lysidine synthase n=1 Tax=Vreelandella vilamensis TaxID=531309 RepID=A0ABU1H095_9GAMM|nr:tRNA lysidine(34) synthetase TilS [Halomonas vilamensis]MDR5897740.1 tRNA lysidine(34) synthetase TilS [Halomonas vilamensis]